MIKVSFTLVFVLIIMLEKDINLDIIFVLECIIIILILHLSVMSVRL